VAIEAVVEFLSRLSGDDYCKTKMTCEAKVMAPLRRNKIFTTFLLQNFFYMRKSYREQSV